MSAIGFADVSNQNAWLDNMQITMFEPKDNKKRRLFSSPYGNRITLSSSPNQSTTKGTGEDICYAASQADLT
ncbi:hypothetical protein [Bartonella gliris]|uniref:hypothetical protein n=1 Tax=Bartonella gliris TaxID=3004109 RepID=UPI00295E75B0|nr:hypothetical protein [Bartonella gliris]